MLGDVSESEDLTDTIDLDLDYMIGTGNNTIDRENSVCAFPDRKSSKGMCVVIASVTGFN